jgi:hypothetical protein
MSADNMVYLQRCPDGKWRAWHGFASADDCEERPTSGFIVETESRSDAVVAAHDWNLANYTEYGVVELEPDDASEGTAMTEPTLPALPESPIFSADVFDGNDTCDDQAAFTAIQMRAFYLDGFAAGVAMERERCAVLLDAYAKLGNCTDFAENMAAAIRKEPT